MSAEVIALLKSIDNTLKRIYMDRDGIEAKGRKTGPSVAPGADLDSTYGDPELRFKPRDWTGDNPKGWKFSECPPELLDMVAESLEYFAQQSEEKGEVTSSGKAVAPYKRKDAARARGWAARKRAGWKPPQEATDDGDARWDAPEDVWQ